MTHPAAKGERFIAASGDSMSMLDIARVLRARRPSAFLDGCRGRAKRPSSQPPKAF